MKMDNVYTPPLTRTIHPPIDHRRYAPNFTQITDEHREQFFNRFDKKLLAAVRRIKNS